MLHYRAGETSSTLLNTTVVDQPWHHRYQLGLGVDAVSGQLRGSAVKPFAVQDAAPMASSYDYSLVQSESDMSTLISGSAKGSYNIEGATVSASTSFLNKIAVSELAVTLVARVSVERSQYSMAPAYELAVTPGHDFRDKYGDYFVAGYRAASSLFVVYQCRFRSVEERTQFTASLTAEVPEVMTAEGSTAFEKTAKATNASVNIHISTQGVDGSPPTQPDGWNPAQIVKILLPWFESHQAPNQLEVYLMHYRLVDPDISGLVPVSPDIFAQLSFLYDRFWLVRGLFGTCPDFGRHLVEESYTRLAAQIEANQAHLPEDEAKIEQLTGQAQQVLAALREINNRQAFASQLRGAAATEPARGSLIDADKGRVHWIYGFTQASKPGITINSRRDSVQADWKIGWREHTFSFHDPTKLIVGWEVICHWDDGTGGDWRKDSDTVIGTTSAQVYVKSDYDRGYSWSVVWYFVDADLYPPTG